MTDNQKRGEKKEEQKTGNFLTSSSSGKSQTKEDKKTEKLIESLSPHELKILPYLDEEIVDICKKTNLDKVSVLRALEYLQNKEIVKLLYSKKKIIEIGVNGALYRKKELPERRLLNLVNEKRILGLQDAQKQASLTDDEFKAAIGVLKRKALIDLKKEKLILNADKSETTKKMLEEIFLDSLPLDFDSLEPEQKFAFDSLKNRRNLVEIKEETIVEIQIPEIGKNLMKLKIKEGGMIEQITPEMIRDDSWRGRKFRRYDVTSPVPLISGGKRHFVNQAIEHARKIWTEMGFQEMTGNLVQSSFWNFDALFSPQDHPAREMQDTFFINHKEEIQNQKLVKSVRQAHEEGVAGSKGWRYKWDEEKAKKLLLRTHTTCLSALTLSKLKEGEIPAKFFAVGKCFRNETLDWKHAFEFNQTEGIVVDKNANFKQLLGYLKEFSRRMGYEKVKFFPSYYPFTEPSVDGYVWNEEKKEWVEVLAAGIFRPEVTEPLLGKPIPVLAWGPGFDRMLMGAYQIKDLRELYKNDINQLRKIKFWMKT